MTSTIERGPVLTACEKRNADAVVEWCVANCRFPEGPEYAKYNNKETHTRAAQCGVYLYANVFKYNYGYRAEDVEIAKALYKDRRVDMESVRNGSADYNVLLREDKSPLATFPKFSLPKNCVSLI